MQGSQAPWQRALDDLFRGLSDNWVAEVIERPSLPIAGAVPSASSSSLAESGATIVERERSSGVGTSGAVSSEETVLGIARRVSEVNRQRRLDDLLLSLQPYHRSGRAEMLESIREELRGRNNFGWSLEGDGASEMLCAPGNRWRRKTHSSRMRKDEELVTDELGNVFRRLVQLWALVGSDEFERGVVLLFRVVSRMRRKGVILPWQALRAWEALGVGIPSIPTSEVPRRAGRKRARPSEASLELEISPTRFRSAEHVLDSGRNRVLQLAREQQGKHPLGPTASPEDCPDIPVSIEKAAALSNVAPPLDWFREFDTQFVCRECGTAISIATGPNGRRNAKSNCRRHIESKHLVLKRHVCRGTGCDRAYFRRADAVQHMQTCPRWKRDKEAMVLLHTSRPPSQSPIPPERPNFHFDEENEE